MTTVSRRTITDHELDQVQQSRERNMGQKVCGFFAKVGLVGGAALYLTSKYVAPYFMPATTTPDSNPYVLGAPSVCTEEDRGYSFPHREVELAADISLGWGLLNYVADPIIGRLWRSNQDTVLETFYTNIHPLVALKAYATGDYNNGSIAEILSQGPSAIIDNIKYLFGHTNKKGARTISENLQGKRLLSVVYNETVKAMGLTQSDRGVLSGHLDRQVTKDDLIQMVVSMRRYGLRDQAAALETYAVDVAKVPGVTRENIAANLQQVDAKG